MSCPFFKQITLYFVVGFFTFLMKMLQANTPVLFSCINTFPVFFYFRLNKINDLDREKEN